MKRTLGIAIAVAVVALAVAWGVRDSLRVRRELAAADSLITALDDSIKVAQARYDSAIAATDSVIDTVTVTITNVRTVLADSLPVYVVELPLPGGGTAPTSVVPLTRYTRLASACSVLTAECERLKASITIERLAALERIRTADAKADTAVDRWRRLIPRARPVSFGVCAGPSFLVRPDPLGVETGIAVTAGVDWRPPMPRFLPFF